MSFNVWLVKPFDAETVIKGYILYVLLYTL